ncbi:hypothetical protein D1814_07825 [Alteromonas sp. BL110]|uniref:hypothetical protein n=1 Tax=Alteromonas sp. BL110 TaxID=1714845 RepID=UPI000E4D8463|nr:hypothetical protein [Alteromonas sp. BL110]AXT38585.1 hypothetical protein D1814_07825 [Alteromonas sp. BL110]RKM83265.1 hypothetical protein D7031_04630 [Alteromonas sp. BL110]
MTNSAAAPLPSQVKKTQSRSERRARKMRTANAAERAEQKVNAELTPDANLAKGKTSNAFADKKNIMWVLLSGAMALTFIVMLFLPDTGMGGGIISTYSAMLWCGFFGAALWRYRTANGWAGFAYGSVIGLVLQFISQII